MCFVVVLLVLVLVLERGCVCVCLCVYVRVGVCVGGGGGPCTTSNNLNRKGCARSQWSVVWRLVRDFSGARGTLVGSKYSDLLVP